MGNEDSFGLRLREHRPRPVQLDGCDNDSSGISSEVKDMTQKEISAIAIL
jgi:hypothetical protein